MQLTVMDTETLHHDRHQSTAPQPSASPVSKLYIENTLLRVSGALFCHDPKRAAVCTGEITINPGVAERHIVARPDPQLGQPGQLTHKIFVALLKKHSDYGRRRTFSIAGSPLLRRTANGSRTSPTSGRQTYQPAGNLLTSIPIRAASSKVSH